MSNSPEPLEAPTGPSGRAPQEEPAGRPSSYPPKLEQRRPDSIAPVRRFPLLPEYRAAAELWLDPEQDTAPVTPLDAACTVLLRDSPQGVQTYLCAHELRSPFGSVAFPGGRVTGADDDPVPWSGPTSKQWAGLLQEDVGDARRAVMAAARTLFVSTGVLLAGRRSDSTITMTGGHDWMSVREDVAAGESSMAELLHERRLVLRTELLRPMARWVTAEFVHRRFDLRCFLVILPERQEPSPLRSRDRPGAWVSPEQILRARETDTGFAEAARSGDPGLTAREALAGAEPHADLHRLLTPFTLLLLEDLAGAGCAIAAAAHRPHLAPRMARLDRDDDGRLCFAVDRRSGGRRRR
ncbi:hypothetical protein ACH0BA_00145 [Kocuria palustris]|uniref:hypothetical protein n=1 Tax=Kocuria TaxID=57493 RepID=UPI0010F7FB8D|nr:hypothetical protein [Kocuria sp. 2SI]